ncbi:MAG: transglycosylase domain-containing protein [Patescibacteria group bacterium]
MRRRLQRQMAKQRLILMGLFGLIGLVIVGFIAAFIMFLWIGRDLPSPGKLSQSSQNSTVFYDRNGKIIYELYKDKNRVPVPIKDISKYLQQGTIAIEDKTFYTNSGISQSGILRSFILLIVKHKISGGGSTITQQLIKNVLLDASQSPTRKIKEAILAVEVNKRYTKDQILEMYLNEAPYGGSYWGVGTASRAYFDKDPKDLNLVQSAILAGLPQSPSYYSPFIGEKDAWKARTTAVLRRMREDRYITKDQEKEAVKQLDSIKFNSAPESFTAAHFIFYIKRIIEKEYGEKILDQGLQIKTTIDLDMQRKAEKIVKDQIAKLEKGGYGVTNGAVLALDSTNGEILAYVGSHDYSDLTNGQFDVISQGVRQPGSTLKPLEYAVAFDKGYTPATVMMDMQTTFPNQGSKDYIPQNYNGKFNGPIQIRYALGNSLNLPAVKMLAMIGLQDFLKKANDMGMPEMAPTTQNINNLGLSASLGGGSVSLLHLTTSYSVFANAGKKLDVVPYTEIKDYKKKVIFKAKPQNAKQILSPEIAYLISNILSDDGARKDTFGLGSLLNIRGKTVAVKTGTTDDKVDNYAVGFTKGVTLGVWVGNNDYKAMNPRIASGITGATPIWHDLMTELLKKYDDGIMAKPDKVKSVEIDSYLGGLPHESDPKRTELFIEGNEPKEVSSYYKKLKISKSNGKLANDVEIKNGNYDEKEYIVLTENDPISTDGKNRWQEGIDAWINGQGNEKLKYPHETSDNSADDVVVTIKSPGDHQTVGNDFELEVKIVSGANIKNIKLYKQGSEFKNIDGNNREIKESMHLDDGTYELKVVAVNDRDKRNEAIIKIGVNKPWDFSNVTPTPTVTPTPVVSTIPAP